MNDDKSKNILKDNAERKPIDIFSNLKTWLKQ